MIAFERDEHSGEHFAADNHLCSSSPARIVFQQFGRLMRRADCSRRWAFAVTLERAWIAPMMLYCGHTMGARARDRVRCAQTLDQGCCLSLWKHPWRDELYR